MLLQAMHREPLTPELREFFQSCYRALAARKQAEEIAELMKAAESHGYPDTREDLMTWAQELEIKGRQEGISLGQLRDKQDVLIRQLDRKFGIDEAERELIRAMMSRPGGRSARQISGAASAGRPNATCIAASCAA